MSHQPHPGCRIRSARPLGTPAAGPKLLYMPTPRQQEYVGMMGNFRGFMEDLPAGQRYAGIALVGWTTDGWSNVFLRVEDASRIPGILVGAFVKERLEAHVVSAWARGTQ